MNPSSLLEVPHFTLDDAFFSLGELSDINPAQMVADPNPSTFIQIVPDNQDIFSFINTFTNHDTNQMIGGVSPDGGTGSTSSPISSSGTISPTDTTPTFNRKSKRKFEEIEQDNMRLQELLKIPNHELTPEEKEEKRKLRNRCTAKRSRDERKTKIEELTHQNQQLQQQVKSLQTELHSYKSKVATLEQQVLALRQPPSVNKKYYSILFVVFAFVFLCMTTINIGIHTTAGKGSFSFLSFADLFSNTTASTANSLMQKGRSLLHLDSPLLKPKVTLPTPILVKEHDENIEEEILDMEHHLMEDEIPLLNHFFVLNHENENTIQFMTPMHKQQTTKSPAAAKDFEIFIPIEIRKDPFHSNEKCVRVVQYHVSKDSNPTLFNKLASVVAG